MSDPEAVTSGLNPGTGAAAEGASSTEPSAFPHHALAFPGALLSPPSALFAEMGFREPLPRPRPGRCLVPLPHLAEKGPGSILVCR